VVFTATGFESFVDPIRSDPRTGKQTFTATTVTLGDPDPALFELPAGFRIADHRQPAATPQN
jgi:hypothetical protein